MLAALVMLVACRGGAATDSADTQDAVCADAPDVTWDNWAHGFFISYCLPCHSSLSDQRYGAPDGVNFDSEAEVSALASSVRTTVLDEESMPIGGGVRQEDLNLLTYYLDCGLK